MLDIAEQVTHVAHVKEGNAYTGSTWEVLASIIYGDTVLHCMPVLTNHGSNVCMCPGDSLCDAHVGCVDFRIVCVLG